MNQYLLNGKLTAKPGHQEALATILLQASELVATAKGCRLYVIGTDKADSHSVYITEIWDSKEDHDQSLNVEGLRELITQAMPYWTVSRRKGKSWKLLVEREFKMAFGSSI